MQVTSLEIPGLVLFNQPQHHDHRGYFAETFRRHDFVAACGDVELVQDNVSWSQQGVLRGLHFQHRQPQGKLVQVLNGQIFDVAVDLRVDSPWFGKHVGLKLMPGQSLWLPPGFAHGFYTLSDEAVVAYKCSAYFAPDDQYSIRFDDPQLAIDWPWLPDPFDPNKRLLITSENDAQAPMLAAMSLFNETSKTPPTLG